MKLAYVDTSCLVAISSAFVRERVPANSALPFPISWVVPDRPLTDEIARVLDTGYVRGADCWHLATALYLAGEPEAISFVTLDERQAVVARALGFQV